MDHELGEPLELVPVPVALLGTLVHRHAGGRFHRAVRLFALESGDHVDGGDARYQGGHRCCSDQAVAGRSVAYPVGQGRPQEGQVQGITGDPAPQHPSAGHAQQSGGCGRLSAPHQSQDEAILGIVGHADQASDPPGSCHRCGSQRSAG
jgi:hypothetical protein